MNEDVVTEGYSGADLKFLIRSIILNTVNTLKFSLEECAKRRLPVLRSIVSKALQEVHRSTSASEYERLKKWRPAPWRS